MSFLSDVYKLFGGGGNLVEGFSIVNIDGHALYIDGITRILQINDDCIRLATRKCILEIVGDSLSVTQSINDSIVIIGDIVGVTKVV
ncbi:MAG: YabP/YqfC family sporulation protein [Firmicutes bacterium]|nr:YabP/YqfC family sporulation protein [Bacillota bacterium]MCL1953140.1 YabP/YqfC family sporulation protein [Bacillota bacterium]